MKLLSSLLPGKAMLNLHLSSLFMSVRFFYDQNVSMQRLDPLGRTSSLLQPPSPLCLPISFCLFPQSFCLSFHFSLPFFSSPLYLPPPSHFTSPPSHFKFLLVLLFFFLSCIWGFICRFSVLALDTGRTGINAMVPYRISNT